MVRELSRIYANITKRDIEIFNIYLTSKLFYRMLLSFFLPYLIGAWVPFWLATWSPLQNNSQITWCPMMDTISQCKHHFHNIDRLLVLCDIRLVIHWNTRVSNR